MALRSAPGSTKSVRPTSAFATQIEPPVDSEALYHTVNALADERFFLRLGQCETAREMGILLNARDLGGAGDFEEVLRSPVWNRPTKEWDVQRAILQPMVEAMGLAEVVILLTPLIHAPDSMSEEELALAERANQNQEILKNALGWYGASLTF